MVSEPAPLTVSHVSCVRGGRRLFVKKSFVGHSGDMIELRGPNGAGKSSLLRLLAGLDDPAEGEIAIVGGFNYVGHLDAIKPVMTARENLQIWADLMRDADVGRALDAFALTPLADDLAMVLSQGQKRRLALSRLALARRAVWLLDEPTVGLDDASLSRLGELITAHRASGGVVVAATHVSLQQPGTVSIHLSSAS